MQKKLDTQTETQVVAMLARGDSQSTIVTWLKRDRGIDIAIPTIGLIRRRNKLALQFMKNEIVKHETTAATTILGKSRRLIDQRLDRAMKLDDELRKLREERDDPDTEMTDTDYYHRIDVILKSQLSVQELNALSKESFNQSQIEAGKPTSIAENPAQAKANLEVLLRAIASNDQATMVKAVFPDA